MIGGPGSSGVLIAKNKLFHKAFDIETTTASTPGGGMIDCVWSGGQTYSRDVEFREDSGTPGILQSIRAGLAFKVKDMVGCRNIEKLEQVHSAYALSEWKSNGAIALMGADRWCYHIPTFRVSIFSFNILSPISMTDLAANDGIAGPVLHAAASHTVKTLNYYANIGYDEPSSGAMKIPLNYNFVMMKHGSSSRQ